MVLSPTRELAIQIAEQIEALGAGIGVKCAVLVGGIDLMSQVGAGRAQQWVLGKGRSVEHKCRAQCASLHCTACSTETSRHAWGAAYLVLLAIAASMVSAYSRCTAASQ